ncbi:MAG: GTPase [Pseudomonadota bacterium]|nr:GTPase [Pseudomonadota bacterium]
MRLKSFHAPTITEAMKQVRDVMGDEAIIVATREEPESGGVRVTAAVDETTDPPLFDAPTFAIGPNDCTGEHDLTDMVSEALHRHGLPADVGQRLLPLIMDSTGLDAHEALSKAISTVMHFKPIKTLHPHGPVMLVGTPGGGKTTSLAKLAARLVLTGQPPAILTVDTVRAGGVQQLRAYTDVLKIKLIAAEDPASLNEGIKAVGKNKTVLIDTPGTNPFDDIDVRFLHDLIRVSNAEPVLVMAAGGDPFESADIAEAYAALGVKRLLPTRLDMTRRLGGILTAAERGGLALTEGGNTSRIADGLIEINPPNLARALLTENGFAFKTDVMQ